MTPDGAEVIYAYTRAMAIADGVLVAVPSELAREAGIVVPAVLTAGAWHEAVAVPPHLRGIQDVTGRLWDVLTMLRIAIRRSRDDDDRVDFQVLVYDGARHKTVDLYALSGPGDDGELVITIMRTDED
jgi:hypothetical protein